MGLERWGETLGSGASGFMLDALSNSYRRGELAGAGRKADRID